MQITYTPEGDEAEVLQWYSDWEKSEYPNTWRTPEQLVEDQVTGFIAAARQKMQEEG